jgi:hypothetical protein
VLLAVVVVFDVEVVSPVAAVPVLLAVDVDGVVAVVPSRRWNTGGASGLSEFTVVSVDVLPDVVFELVVLSVVEVDAGRDGSGHVADCEAFGDVLAALVLE